MMEGEEGSILAQAHVTCIVYIPVVYSVSLAVYIPPWLRGTHARMARTIASRSFGAHAMDIDAGLYARGKMESGHEAVDVAALDELVLPSIARLPLPSFHHIHLSHLA